MQSLVINSGEHNELSKLVITGSEALRLVSPATVYDDILTSTYSARTGTPAPTIGTGFRGDNNILHTTFINTQADEQQFDIQFPHGWAVGTTFYPHVHFCPAAAGGANNAVRFILGYRFAGINEQFPAAESTYEMTKTWNGDKSWYHYIADNAAGLSIPTGNISAIMKCRVYRDNSVTNNMAAAVSILYYDWHIEIDTLGSREEYIK